MEDLKLELITPAKAQKLVNKNNSNRKLRSGVVERYTSDMLSDRWTRCTAPIAIYDDGDIADGQHRLWAIIESNKAQRFYVMRNLSREDGLNIDTGLGRSLVDNARISGSDEHLSNELLSVTRVFADGRRSQTGGRGLSSAEKLDLVDKYREPAQWAIANGPRRSKGLRNSMILTAIARASTKEKDLERLAEFCKVFDSGFGNGEQDSAAIAMRNYIISNPGMNKMEGPFRDGFLKVQNAIWYFMRKKKLYIIKVQSEERYPNTLGG